MPQPLDEQPQVYFGPSSAIVDLLSEYFIKGQAARLVNGIGAVALTRMYV